MAQGKSPRSPLAFASVLYPGRCLAVELAKPQHQKERSLLVQGISQTFRAQNFRTSCLSSYSRLRSCLRSCLRSRLRSRRRTCGRTKAPPHLRPNQGGGFVVDLPYQMLNNYEA